MDGILLTGVCALPQTVAAAGTKEDNLRVLGVDGQPLTSSAARHVAANLEGKGGSLPGLALVGAARKCSILGVPAMV